MKKDGKKRSDASATRIADKRFASFETDPRFRLPSKKHAKTTLDKRFAGMLKDNEFTATSKVDRYGRKLKSDSKKKALERLYQLEDEEKDEGGDSEDHSEDESEAEHKKQDEEEEASEDDEDIDPDEIVQRELREAHEKYDPARGGGFSSSESDSDSSDEDSEDDEVGGAEVTAGDIQKFQDEQADIEAGEVTNRIAIVNLDWDHVKSTDLMALFSSFLPAEDGKVDKVSVYPSEFGKERMQQEEIEGPPKALFKKKDNDSSDDSEDDSDDDGDEKIKQGLLQEGNDEDFDSDALRAYQLDRLRYYYAVMVCSSPQAAKKIYDATDGTEYQSSSNFLDLRFVPDEVAFDDQPRDECDAVPDSYKPVEFVTNALQSSKVKLTWDMHPEEASRKDSIKRAFSGSRNEIEESDLKAYLASDSEDDDGESAGEEEAEVEDAPKLSKKELARKKMREALGLADEPASRSKDGPVGDMEVTFTPALSGDSKPKKPEEEETTIEKYKRKERERKEKKRQAAKARRGDVQEEASDVEIVAGTGDFGDEDLGFDDPFFTTAGEDVSAPSKTSQRKEERLKKRAAKDAQAATDAAEKARLQSIMAEDNNDGTAAHLDHFDMADIVRSEKHKSKKGKKSKKKAEDISARGKLQKDFQMDVDDNRFKAVFDSHEYAIDPSNPKYKATEGMKKILEEGRRKRHGGEAESRPAKKPKKNRR